MREKSLDFNACIQFSFSFKLSLQIERMSHVTMQLDFGQWAALDCLKLMISYVSEVPLLYVL